VFEGRTDWSRERINVVAILEEATTAAVNDRRRAAPHASATQATRVARLREARAAPLRHTQNRSSVSRCFPTSSPSPPRYTHARKTSGFAGGFPTMTVTVRTYRRGGFEVDIRFTWPDGSPYRDRRRSPVSGKSASLRWGQAREMDLLRAGPAILEPAPQKKEVETLNEFAPRFIKGYARAERQKASTIATTGSARRGSTPSRTRTSSS